MTFFTVPAAVLGEPSYKGHLLAAEEINAHGGLLGKRKIEIIKADEAAGTDANVKELKRMKLSEKIDMFTGVISSGNTPALGPVAEELKVLTIFTDGCTDFLFDKAVPNPHYIYPGGDRWPINKTFVERYHARWKEYPNFQSEGAYVTLYMLKDAVERANRLMGGWPEDEAIIGQLEGLGFTGPAGYMYIRPDNHQAYKDAITGFSKNVPEYPFPILDPDRIITIPIRNITAPPGWPKREPTSTYSWIEETWPAVKA